MATEYTAVSKDTFDAEVLNSDGFVLVDFWADWCQPCHYLDPIIDEVAAKTEGKLKIVKVNADENLELAQKYNILGLPTMMLVTPKKDEQGNRVMSKKVGFAPFEPVSAWLKGEGVEFK